MRNVAGWTPAFNTETIGMAMGSRLCSAPVTCWDYLDFTYFQTFVLVPPAYNLNLTEFSIQFSGMDDGSRITVFNSRYAMAMDGRRAAKRGP
jgi:hypothetical protein